MKKIISVILIVVLAANLTLFALGKISLTWFWIIIAAIALFAYKVLPNLKKST